MSTSIRDCRNTIAKLEKNIKLCERYKSSVTKQLTGAIKQKWLNKYNQRIKKYQKEVARLNSRIRAESVSSVKTSLDENIKSHKEYSKEVTDRQKQFMII